MILVVYELLKITYYSKVNSDFVRGPFGIRRFPLIVIYADTESIATKIFENANSPEALLHPCNYSKQSK